MEDPKLKRLHLAVIQGRIKYVEKFLSLGDDVNHRDSLTGEKDFIITLK